MFKELQKLEWFLGDRVVYFKKKKFKSKKLQASFSFNLETVVETKE